MSNQNGTKMVRCWVCRWGTLCGVFAMLLFVTGCGQSRRGDFCSIDVQCDDINICTNNRCSPVTGTCSFTPINCDDGDACTVDFCSRDFGCGHRPVECPPDQVCDPATGLCVGEGGGATGLLGAVGTFSGSIDCGDTDDTVSLTADAGTLVLGGFEGNDDIALTLTDDSTATATNVVAFGIGGHNLTLVLNLDATIALELIQPDSGASCETLLMPQ